MLVHRPDKKAQMYNNLALYPYCLEDTFLIQHLDLYHLLVLAERAFYLQLALSELLNSVSIFGLKLHL